MGDRANPRSTARAMGRARGARDMARAVGRTIGATPDRSQCVQRPSPVRVSAGTIPGATDAATVPRSPTTSGSRASTVSSTSLRFTAYLFSAVSVGILLWYLVLEDFSVPYSTVTTALLFCASVSVVGVQAGSAGQRLVLLLLGALGIEGLLGVFGFAIAASFSMLIAALVLVISVLGDAVTGPLTRADILRGLRAGSVWVAVLAGVDTVLGLAAITSYGLTVDPVELLLGVLCIVGLIVLATVSPGGQRRPLAVTGGALVALAAMCHLGSIDSLDLAGAQHLMLFLGLAALLTTFDRSLKPLGEVSTGGGPISVAWANCRMWVGARWAQLLAFGFFGAVVSVLWIVLGLLVAVVLPLTLLLANAEGQDPDSGWGIALFVAAVGLPQLAGLLAGAGGVVIDQAMAAALLGGRMEARSFWRAFSAQGKTSLLLALGYFLGFLVCFIPGILLVVRWGFALPFGVGHGQRGSAALSGSWRLTEGRGWTVLGFQLLSNVAVLVAMGAGLLLAYVCQWLWGAAWLSWAASIGVWGFVMAVSAVGRVSLYEQFTGAGQAIAGRDA